MFWPPVRAKKPAPRPAPMPTGLAVIPYDPVPGQAGEMIVNAPHEPAPPPPKPFYIPPPDWDQERREEEERERERERQERERLVAEELDRIAADAEEPETRPAKPGWRP